MKISRRVKAIALLAITTAAMAISTSASMHLVDPVEISDLGTGYLNCHGPSSYTTYAETVGNRANASMSEYVAVRINFYEFNSSLNSDVSNLNSEVGMTSVYTTGAGINPNSVESTHGIRRNGHTEYGYGEIRYDN